MVVQAINARECFVLQIQCVRTPCKSMQLFKDTPYLLAACLLAMAAVLKNIPRAMQPRVAINLNVYSNNNPKLNRSPFSLWLQASKQLNIKYSRIYWTAQKMNVNPVKRNVVITVRKLWRENSPRFFNFFVGLLAF